MIPLKGLAQAGGHPEDLDTLNCHWYYDWGANASLLSDPRYIPMSRNFEMVDLPLGYNGYLLVGNEPNVPEPYGAGIKANPALCRYTKLVERYTEAKMIVGGVSYWDKATSEIWLKAFRDQLKDYGLPKPYGYHLHGYKRKSNAAWNLTSSIEAWWKKMHSWVNTPIWITEYNTLTGNASTLKKLTNWIKAQPWIERYACFTNRSTPADPWSIGDGVNLITQDGQLTNSGVYYAGIQ